MKRALRVAGFIFFFLAGAVRAACQGTIFNPITHTDWNNIYPISVAGVRMGTGVNPPLMEAIPPVWVCPRFPLPSPGITVAYWEPQYIAEAERTPGCLSTLGGIEILQGYSMLQSEKSLGNDALEGSTCRGQIHWYSYPVFQALDMMTSLACRRTSGVNLTYLTEIDPSWQSDTIGSLFSPEAALFANPVLYAACAVDAAASALGLPMDPLFWCQGTWGSIYPLTGNSQHCNTDWQQNNSLIGKFLARSHRWGLQWQTIGVSTLCAAHPNPLVVKSQYRFNQVFPVPLKGKPVSMGDTHLGAYPPVTNYPTMESSAHLIWQGQTCTLTLW